MNFTTKSRYAVNALADLEYLSNDESPVSLKDIAIRQDIELTYLEQLFRKLRIAGIVKSIRGRNGGYVYASHPHEISIKHIMDAVEENLDATNFVVLQTTASVQYARVGPGEFTFFAVNDGVGLEARADTATCNVEYAYWKKA